jgi:hypothetical protein
VSRPTGGIAPLSIAPRERPLLEHRVAVFAEAMQRRPSGLVMWDDGSVRPAVARADSWGLGKADLVTEAAKARLLPLYVEQELRLGRLERELMWHVDSEAELLDREMKFKSKLSKEARNTLEAYERSQLLRAAIERVHREFWLGRGVESRQRQLEQRGIDWRTIGSATHTRASPATPALQPDRGIGR